MGIRFYCPNGHKLNVKSFLAGKRGICPHCGVKLIIPELSEATPSEPDKLPTAKRAAGTTSAEDPSTGPTNPTGNPTGPVPTAEVSELETSSAAPHSPAAQETSAEEPPSDKPPADRTPSSPATESLSPSTSDTEPKVPPQLPPMISPCPDPLDELPDAVWYLRLATGDQYGPAQAEIVRQWLAEQRIPPDAFVWRDDWPDWRRAGSVFGLTPDLPFQTGDAATWTATPWRPPGDAPSDAASSAADGELPGIFPPSEMAVGKRESVASGLPSRRRRSRGLLTVLIIAVVLLMALFVFVASHPGFFSSASG